MTTAMHPVDSDLASYIGHDADTGTVHVTFKKGGQTHPFGPFTRAEFEEFKNAPSIGKHFHARIKTRAITAKAKKR
jgi:hypothetical protein